MLPHIFIRDDTLFTSTQYIQINHTVYRYDFETSALTTTLGYICDIDFILTENHHAINETVSRKSKNITTIPVIDVIKGYEINH